MHSQDTYTRTHTHTHTHLTYSPQAQADPQLLNAECQSSFTYNSSKPVKESPDIVALLYAAVNPGVNPGVIMIMIMKQSLGSPLTLSSLNCLHRKLRWRMQKKSPNLNTHLFEWIDRKSGNTPDMLNTKVQPSKPPNVDSGWNAVPLIYPILEKWC